MCRAFPHKSQTLVCSPHSAFWRRSSKSWCSRGSASSWPDFCLPRKLVQVILPAHQRSPSRPALLPNQQLTECLLKKERESGTAVAWARCCVPGSHWPSVSLLMASLSSSQRSRPLTQTAGRVMETIFSYKTFLLCSVYVSGSGGTFEDLLPAL